MTCTLLGTGTSHGIPVIGCDCPVCASGDPRDKRFRTGAWIRSGPEDGRQKPVSLLIDAGPEFRLQAVAHNITWADAILVTHSHADHIHGLDDLRIFSYNRNVPKDERRDLRLYSNEETLSDIRSRFSYAFKPTQEGGGKPRLRLLPCEGFTPEHPLAIGDLSVVYVPMKHGSLTAAGWVVSRVSGGEKHSIAYLTDCSHIPPESIDRIRRAAGCCDHAVLDGLRKTPHSTHFSFDQAFEAAQKIGAKHTWITHICHLHSHREIEDYFQTLTEDAAAKEVSIVSPAWDGLKLEA